MQAFDYDRLREIEISQAGLSKLRLFPKVYPYAFWVWQIPELNRQGGMVCFRGEGRPESPGMRDVKAAHWWMAKYYRLVGGIDGLVVDMCEYFGYWHERLTFLPASIDWPDTFRVIYVTMPKGYDRAVELWGEENVRKNHREAMAEMDEYLSSLPEAPRELKVKSLSDAINIGLPPDQIDELISQEEPPVRMTFGYKKPDASCRTRYVTVVGVSGQSIRAIDLEDGKQKNFRLDRIVQAQMGIDKEV